MKYLAYKDCKPTNKDWFGDIPKHWILKALKHAVIIPVTDGPHATPEILDDGIAFISAEAIRNDKIDFTRKRGFISLDDHQLFSRKYLPQKDDIYVIKSGATTGNIAMVETDIEFNIWSPLAAIRVDKSKALPKFIFYFLKSECFHTSIVLGWSFGTQQNIGMNVIENLTIVAPTLPEQQSITAFLDYKTKQIDELIEKKEQLLKLLEEKRIALITQAVTKGLNPNVKMKPGGIDWVGEIPEHWEVWKLTHSFQVIGSGTTPKSDNSEYYDGDYLWVTTSELRETIIYDTKQKLTEYALQDHSTLKFYDEGSVLIAMYGATIGRLGILGVKATVNQACCAFSKPTNIHPNFFYYWLIMRRPILISLSTGGGQPNLNQDELKKIKIPIPTLEEQIKIVEFLEEELVRGEALSKKIQTAIDNLKEYRKALITTAVTGKIDVRDFKPERVE